MSDLPAGRDPHEPPLFVAIAEFCMARGAKALSKIPGCYEVQIAETMKRESGALSERPQ